MAPSRLLASILILSPSLFSQSAPSPVEEAAQRFAAQAAKVPGDLRVTFQLAGAQALAPKYPELSRRLLDPVIEQIRAGKIKELDPEALRSLAAASPKDAIAMTEFLPADARTSLVSAFLFSHHTAEAMRVYRDSMAHGRVLVQPAMNLVNQLSKDDPAQAKSLFRQVLEAVPTDIEPFDAWQLINGAQAIGKIDPQLAAAAYCKILDAAVKPDYGAGKTSVTGRFAAFDTGNSRDTMLVAAGGRLLALDPEKAAPYQKALSRWDLSKPPATKGVSFSNPGAHPSTMPPEISALYKRSAELRGDLPDAERAKLAIDQAARIDALLASPQKLDLARGLTSLSTEGDLGKQALAAVANTLAHALHEHPGAVMDYVSLASLVRYEHVPPPAFEDPAEKAGESLLALRDQIHQSAGFTLTGLDGKTWSLDALRGKIVLLNFWATWCPPCRKEMPDMQKLSKEYAGKGLVVLAVSDEDHDTVAPFIAKQGYTFPVLLDTDGKVHGDFDVVGIPKTFIFDREGRIAANAIDMRTMSQFLELLKQAGM